MTTRRRNRVPANADALDILRSWTKDDSALQRMIAEERSNTAVARQIYELRTARGLTQRQLADLVETKQPVISRHEDADYEGHSLSMLSRIADALGCSVEVSFVPRSAKAGPQGRAAPERRKGRRRAPKSNAASRDIRTFCATWWYLLIDGVALEPPGP